MALRIVIPPHPLISHWLSILRVQSTPAPIYATGLSQLGKWLSYEAFRDWLPNVKTKVETTHGPTDGIVIESSIPILAIPNLPGGLELWQGARELIPNATLCLGRIPTSIESQAGIVIYFDQITDGSQLCEILDELKKQNVTAERIRIISVLAASKGLKTIGEKFPELIIYAACIDAELNEKNEIIPGIGNPSARLNTRIT